ncbi:hypothetical protein [Photorhabdus temperata]
MVVADIATSGQGSTVRRRSVGNHQNAFVG